MSTHYQVIESDTTQSQQALTSIACSNVLMSIWKRPVLSDVQGFVNHWKSQITTPVTLTLPPDRSAAENKLRFEWLPQADPELLKAFVDDVFLLVERFKTHTQSTQYQAQLQWITHMMCPRYHCDANRYRLLCTYTGEGTLWTPWHNVHWENTRLPQNLQDPKAVFQARPFDVLLMKGSAHPESHPYGQFHRSPPASPEAPRLVLKIDVV